jgi:hypothetical protein
VGEETSTKAFKQSISEASSSLLFLSHTLTLLLLLLLLLVTLQATKEKKRGQCLPSLKSHLLVPHI